MPNMQTTCYSGEEVVPVRSLFSIGWKWKRRRRRVRQRERSKEEMRRRKTTARRDTNRKRREEDRKAQEDCVMWDGNGVAEHTISCLLREKEEVEQRGQERVRVRILCCASEALCRQAVTLLRAKTVRGYFWGVSESARKENTAMDFLFCCYLLVTSVCVPLVMTVWSWFAADHWLLFVGPMAFVLFERRLLPFW